MAHKIVTAKQLWTCDHCSAVISPKDQYQLIESRLPIYNDDGKQTGVLYDKHRFCLDETQCSKRHVNRLKAMFAGNWRRADHVR